MFRTLTTLVALLAALNTCSAADWEATAAAGFGMYHAVSYHSPAGAAEAGIGPRYGLGAIIGRRFGTRFAVEAAYTFQDGDFEISSGGRKTAYDANTHAIHADLLSYLGPRFVNLRPYAVVGGGVKFYHGVEQPGTRPLGEFGSFRQGVDDRALVTFGGGIEWSFSPHWGLRVDIRDYLTPFPTSVIVPAPGSNLGGWLHDFVPMLGITFR